MTKIHVYNVFLLIHVLTYTYYIIPARQLRWCGFKRITLSELKYSVLLYIRLYPEEDHVCDQGRGGWTSSGELAPDERHLRAGAEPCQTEQLGDAKCGLSTPTGLSYRQVGRTNNRLIFLEHSEANSSVIIHLGNQLVCRGTWES